jgi:hypothetical protein
MDDPRSPYCELTSDEDMERNMPLTAQSFAVRTLQGRAQQIHSFAIHCQTASLDPRDYLGWRARVGRVLRRRAPGLRTA